MAGVDWTRIDWFRFLYKGVGMGWREALRVNECPYDELAQSLRFPGTSMSLPARLLLCEGYNRVALFSDYGDIHEDAHETAMALACGDIE